MHAMQVRRHIKVGQEDESEVKRTEMGINRSRCSTAADRSRCERRDEVRSRLDVKNEDNENTVCTISGEGKPEYPQLDCDSVQRA